MSVDGWYYYEHAALPNCAPHEIVDTTPVRNGKLWNGLKKGGEPILARWTSNYDCEKETQWWYEIKDTPFNIMDLKAKRRYEIKKGQKHYDVHTFCAFDFKEEYYSVDVAAYSVYPPKYRPHIDKEELFKSLYKNTFEDNKVFYGAFCKETGKLCGYILINVFEQYLLLAKQKVVPESEKNGINALLIYAVINDYNARLSKNFYICDGERSIIHETNFQSYLEKYFGFRKAYCNLNIRFNPKISWCIRVLYPLRHLLIKFDSIGLVHKINGILLMEQITREEK